MAFTAQVGRTQRRSDGTISLGDPFRGALPLRPFPADPSAGVTSLSAATVSVVMEGTITQATSDAYPFVDVGDPFRLSISYTLDVVDRAPDPLIESYDFDSFSVTLEIPGEGIALQSTTPTIPGNPAGGMTLWLLQPELPPDRAIDVISRLADGNAFYLIFWDEDRSSFTENDPPVDLGSASDYDQVTFLLSEFGESGRIDGAISIIQVPEPQSIHLICLGAVLLIVIHRKGRRCGICASTALVRRQQS